MSGAVLVEVGGTGGPYAPRARSQPLPRITLAAHAEVVGQRGLGDLGLLGLLGHRAVTALGGQPRRGANELAEQRLGAVRARVELRVELRGDEERVVPAAR